MDPEEFLKKVNNPDFIPGIYNYCDRWCERCSFTSRCANRQLSAEHEADTGKLDLSNKKYWEHLGNVFSDTLKLLQYVSEKKGLEFPTVSKEEVEEENNKREDIEKRAENNPIIKNANAYIKMTDKFFKDEKSFFEEKEKELNQQLKLGINESKISNENSDVNDIFEIISWYKYQVMVKMMRALTADEEDNEWEDENGFQRDSDGSAKVALIGIDRSISAWGRLQQLYTEISDPCIIILFHLDMLRKEIEKEFPQARRFIRAGFDE